MDKAEPKWAENPLGVESLPYWQKKDFDPDENLEEGEAEGLPDFEEPLDLAA